MEETRNVDCEIVADSLNPAGNRLVSYIVTLPRFIWAEALTHRQLSRNAASSRAIPVKRMIKMLREGGAHPEFWGSNKPGMQAGAQLTEEDLASARELWDTAKMNAIDSAEEMMEIGLHKQISNRVLEAWCPYKALVSATQWDNFFSLRAHPDAQPEFQLLAYRMLDARLKSESKQLNWEEWHIPFGDQMYPDLDIATQLKVAVARAARLSYLTFDGNASLEEDLKLFDQLLVQQPLHASPTEHVAMAEPHLWLSSDVAHRQFKDLKGGHLKTTESWLTLKRDRTACNSWPLPYSKSMRHQGNFQGFTQLRKTLPGENVEKADLAEIMATKPDWVTL